MKPNINDMGKKTYHPKFKSGDPVRYAGSSDSFKGATGKVTRVILPGDIFAYTLKNRTGSILYVVRLDSPMSGTNDYRFYESELESA